MKRAVLAALVLAGLSSPALAHAFLETASPAAGDALKTAPSAVTLRFTEALEPAFSRIDVTDTSGADVTAGGTTTDGTGMKVPLKRLAPGRYRVSWQAVSVDTHRTEGRYMFQVLP
jgi:copper resistance protein C